MTEKRFKQIHAMWNKPEQMKYFIGPKYGKTQQQMKTHSEYTIYCGIYCLMNHMNLSFEEAEKMNRQFIEEENNV